MWVAKVFVTGVIEQPCWQQVLQHSMSAAVAELNDAETGAAALGRMGYGERHRTA
jgi:hypothetical protein